MRQQGRLRTTHTVGLRAPSKMSVFQPPLNLNIYLISFLPNIQVFQMSFASKFVSFPKQFNSQKLQISYYSFMKLNPFFLALHGSSGPTSLFCLLAEIQQQNKLGTEISKTSKLNWEFNHCPNVTTRVWQ